MKFLLGFWLGCGVGPSFSAATLGPGELRSLYTEAGDAYQAGRYEQAAQLYEQIVAQGLENGAVFYNLGNAYFQLGQLGRAIVNYHRAQRYLPRDDDVATNLAYAESLRQDEIERAETRAWGTRLWGLTERLTLNECAHALSGSYFLGLAFLFLRLFRNRGNGPLIARYGLGVSLAIGLYWGSGLGWKILSQNRDLRVVVVAEEVSVRNGPGEQAGVVFKVHDGTEMELQERRQGWLRVALTPDQTGWVETSGVEGVQLTEDR